MHTKPSIINVEEILKSRPIDFDISTKRTMFLCMVAGLTFFFVGLFTADLTHLWGVFFVNLVFWMGLSVGGVMIAVIVQVVRATWSAPIRRIAEANVAFLPYAFCLFLFSYFGRGYLFPWANAPMPGREFWMEPDFVYVRFAILLGFLFFMMNRFVSLSLRSDVGLIKEKDPKEAHWYEWPYSWLTAGWKGSSIEINELQNKMSWRGPLIIALYAVIYSLFVFEVVMGMDTIWYSNMFGGFIFLGNIYIAWAFTIMMTVYLCAKSPLFARQLHVDVLWDLGKLMFAFSMLWGYTFFSQFLPQWYGNMPEETAWLIVRTREFPWKTLGYITFTMCFIFPFITLTGEDVKKTPPAVATIAFVVFCGVWLEKYMIIMPQLFPGSIPFGALEVGITLGFLGGYGTAIIGFLSKYPCIAASHPQARDKFDW